MDKWISVHERLPAFNEHCLVYLDYNATWIENEAGRVRVSVAYRSKTQVCGNNPVPWHWCAFGPGTWFAHEVTHWMPVPKAPPK